MSYARLLTFRVSCRHIQMLMLNVSKVSCFDVHLDVRALMYGNILADYFAKVVLVCRREVDNGGGV